MNSLAGQSAILRTLIGKELKLYGRNKLYLFLSALTLVAFVALFWVIPDTVDQTITVGLSPSLEVLLEEGRDFLRELGVPEEMLSQLDEEALADEEGLKLVGLETADDLEAVIGGQLELYRTYDGDYVLRDPTSGEPRPQEADRVHLDVGIAFPPGFIADVAQGMKTTVSVIADAAVPPEIRGAMGGLVREISFQIAGLELPVTLPDEELIVLGPDRVAEQPTFRDTMRPLLAIMILVVETYAIAALISIEVIQRTVTALMVTPMRIWHFLAAKTLVGTALGFGQGILILVLVAAFTPANWSLLVVTMFIGAILFTGVAMIVGAAGKDFIDQLMYAVLFTVPLMIPALSVLFPGTAATWVRLIPSYPIIDLIVGATIYDATLGASLGSLAHALLWVVVLFGLGLLVLRRKVETL